VLCSECRHKKETELRISSVKLKGLLLSHSAVSVCLHERPRQATGVLQPAGLLYPAVSVAALAKAAILSCYLYCLAINLAGLLLND
jgi:hypothetical protein